MRARCRAHGSSKPRGRRGPTCSRAALKICCRSRRTFCSQARASQWRPTPARPQVRSPSPAPNLPLGSSGLGRPSSTAHLPTSARCRARAPGPVSGQLYAAAGEGTSHTAALSCCLSAAGIRLLGILSRPGIAPLLRSAYRATISADPDGVSMFRTHETQLGWAPSIPRGQRCSRDRPEVGGRRLPLPSGQPLSPRSCYPPRGARINGTSSRVHWYSPVQPSPHLWHLGGTGALGLSLKPRTPAGRTRRRTSRAGTGLEH